MILAYVDSSCLVAIAFGEPGAAAVALRLRHAARLVSSNLLEAELRSALGRENVRDDPGPLLSWVGWIHPDRPLTAEFQRIAALGHLKGADLWHLACALFIAPRGRELTFLTLDRRQKEVATKLGFST